MQLRSREDIKRALAHSDILQAERSILPLLLDSKGINSLFYTDPFAKICFTCCAVSELAKDARIIYVDLDTVFTSYVRNGVFRTDGELEILLPGDGQFERLLPDLCSRLDGAAAVVVDSLNSFYHLYDDIKIGKLNRLLGSYISLLLYHTRRAGCRLLVTSMMRHKKAPEWVLAPSSKRLLETRSAAVMRADLSGEGLVVNIIKHEPLKLHSKRVVIPQEEIPLRV